MVFGPFRRWTAAGAPRAPGPMATITLRLATAEDTQVIERLAALYDRPLPTGQLLLAVVDGELQAALTLGGDRELMEPYLPTAALVDLLALRAKQLREQTGLPCQKKESRLGRSPIRRETLPRWSRSRRSPRRRAT
jgi:hypothetical protein